VTSEVEEVKELKQIGAEEDVGRVLARLVPAVGRLMRKLAGGVLSRIVQGRLDHEGLGRPTVGVHRYRRRCWETMVGPLSLERGSCRRDWGYEYPADKALGLPSGDYSLDMEWLIVLLATKGSYEAEVEQLRKMLGVEVCVRTVEDLVERHGRRRVEEEAQCQQDTFERRKPVSAERQNERIAIGIDAAKYRSREDPQEPWKDMKIGCVGSMDKEGKLRGGKAYVAENDKERLGRQLYTEAQRLGMDQAREIVAIGDGAPMNWNLMAQHLPERRVEILDFYHAAEHLTECGAALYGEGTKQAQHWARTQRRRLLNGHYNRVMNELQRRWQGLPRRKADLRKVLSDNIEYFQTNRQRMRYRYFRRCGYPIGSGFIETGCKQIVGMRLKGPGMRWRQAGALHMAKLRGLALSGQLYRFIVQHHGQAA